MIELKNWGYVDLSKVCFATIERDTALDLYQVSLTLVGGTIKSPKMSADEAQKIVSQIVNRKRWGGV